MKSPCRQCEEYDRYGTNLHCVGRCEQHDAYMRAIESLDFTEIQIQHKEPMMRTCECGNEFDPGKVGIHARYCKSCVSQKLSRPRKTKATTPPVSIPSAVAVNKPDHLKAVLDHDLFVWFCEMAAKDYRTPVQEINWLVSKLRGIREAAV